MTGSRTIYQRVESRSIADWKRELAAVQSQGNLLEESKICNSIAKLYENGGRLKSALKYHMADEDICKLLQDTSGMAVARGNLGGVYLKMKDYRRAVESRLVHLSLATESQSYLEIQRANSELGKVYLEWSEVDHVAREEYLALALKYFQDSYHGIASIPVEEFDRDNEKSGCWLTADGLLCEAYTNFGNLYDAQGKQEQAIDFHTRALSLASRVDAASMKVVSLVNLGVIAVHRKQFELGLQYFTECLQLHEKEKSLEGQAEAMGYLGWAYTQASNYSMAFECYSTVYNNVRATFNDVALLKSTSEKLRHVSECLERANSLVHLLRVYEHAKAPQDQLEALAGLAEAHRFLANYEQEVQYNKLAIELITRDEKWLVSKTDELECYYYDTAVALEHLGRSSEAAQYHRKELELIAPERGSDRATALHCLAVSLDHAGEPADMVKQVYQMAYRQALSAAPGDLKLQIDVLLDLKALCHRTGDLEAHEAVKSQLAELHRQSSTEPGSCDGTEIEDDFDYFANRKPSKSLKSFIPGFNMRQKTRKPVGLDLRIKHRGATRPRPAAVAEAPVDLTKTTSTTMGKRRACLRQAKSGKENMMDADEQNTKAERRKDAAFIADDVSDGAGGAGPGFRAERSKSRRTFISDEDDPKSQPVPRDRAAQGGHTAAKSQIESFRPEPIDDPKDPFFPSLASKSAGSTRLVESQRAALPVGKGASRHPLGLGFGPALDAQEPAGGFDDDSAMAINELLASPSSLSPSAGLHATRPVQAAHTRASRPEPKSFAEIYMEECGLAIPPLQAPSKRIIERLGCHGTQLQLNGLGLGLVSSMETHVLLKSLARIMRNCETVYVDLSDNQLEDLFLTEWAKLEPDMSHVETLNVSKNFFTQVGIASLLGDAAMPWPALRTLDCSWNSLSECCGLLIRLFRMDLESLFLSHNQMAVAEHDVYPFFVNSSIVRLSIGYNRHLNPAFVLRFVGAQCETLDLSALSFGPDDGEAAQALLKYRQLERLCLAYSTGLSHGTLSALLANNQRSLRHLDLCYSSYAVPRLALHALSSLSTLLLDGVCMDAHDVVHLIESSASARLGEISLVHCHLGYRDVMRVLLAATTKFLQLLHFSFNVNAFSSADEVDDLLGLLPQFTDLRKLVLAGCFSHEALCYLKSVKMALQLSDSAPRLAGGFILDLWEDYVAFYRPSGLSR